MHIKELLELQIEYRREIEKVKMAEMPVILFGAGKTSEYILKVLNGFGIFPVAFCDNDRKKVGQEIAGVKVIEPKELEDYSDCFIYITTQMYYVEIQNQLHGLGIPDEKIARCDWICQFEWERNYKEFIQQNLEQFEWLYRTLADEQSRKVLRNRLAFLITRERKYAVGVRKRGEAQYFPSGILSFNVVKNFIDIGAYTGDSILQFSGHTDFTKCRVWAFEPDRELYRIALENVGDFENVTVFPYALSDKDGRSQVQAKMGSMQTIETGTFSNTVETGVSEFETCRLDTFFEGKRLHNVYLKMDIEGAELSALRGGEKFIRDCVPSMAICVYHKAGDILDIPHFIKALNPEYAVYLRHYSDNQTETVLYAV